MGSGDHRNALVNYI